MKQITVALAGNPNVGKSTIFNALTGANQHVGNWPGKTVEKKTGQFAAGRYAVTLVDLPGTYSLSPFSPEELIARNFMLQNQPDIVAIVVDAANLERNLYLAVQVLELEAPAILVLSMVEAAQKQGIRINTEMLAQALGIPVVSVTRRANGVQPLVDAIARLAAQEESDVAS